MIRRFFIAIALLFTTGSVMAQLPIKVMSLNIRYSNDKDGINRWDNRKAWMCDFINFSDVDVFGSQEVRHSQLTYMVEALYDYNYYGEGRDGGSKGEYCPIFYKSKKYKLLDKGVFWLSETPDVIASVGWDASLPRLATWVKLRDKETKKEFFFFNTHFDHQGEETQPQSSLLMKAKMKEIAGDIPCFLTGDFNMKPISKGYSNITSGKDALNDSYKETKRKYGTFYTFNGFDPDPDQKKTRIDYVFFTKGVTIEKYHVVDSQRGPRFMTDHYPVIVDAIIK